MQDIDFIVEFGSGGRDRTYDQLINSQQNSDFLEFWIHYAFQNICIFLLNYSDL